MTPALALAFDDWFRVCWLRCIRSSAKYFAQSSHTKSRPVVQADRQTGCICIGGLAEHFWRKGCVLLFMPCCRVLRKHSRHLPTALNPSWLKSGLARWGCAWVGLRLFLRVPFWGVRTCSDMEPRGLQVSQQTLAQHQPSPASSAPNSSWCGWQSAHPGISCSQMERASTPRWGEGDLIVWMHEYRFNSTDTGMMCYLTSGMEDSPRHI